MRNKIVLVLVLAFSALAQFATTIDTTTLSTQSYTLVLNLTLTNPVTGTGFTNGTALEVNTNYILTGDAPAMANFKINQGFSNAWLWSQSQSNLVRAINFAITNFFATNTPGGGGLSFAIGVSNRFLVLSNAWTAFLGTNVPGEPQFLNFETTNHPGSGGSGGTTMNFDSGLITSDGSGDVTVNGEQISYIVPSLVVGSLSNPSGVNDNFTFVDSAAGYALAENYNGNDGIQIQSADSGWTTNATLYLIGSQFEMFSYSAPILMTAPSVGINTSPSETLDVGGSFGSDYEQITSDGIGDLTCVSLTQTSDVNAKTNIAAISPADVLAKLLAVPVYSWNFRPLVTTNYTATNAPVAQASTPAGSGSVPVSGAGAPATQRMTNAVVVRHAANPEIFYGPMAQDWSSKFGGHTNKLSVVSMQGLLLAGEQALAAQQGILTNAAGARFRMVVNAQTNGLVFVAQ